MWAMAEMLSCKAVVSIGTVWQTRFWLLAVFIVKSGMPFQCRESVYIKFTVNFMMYSYFNGI
jgi:hypothetical protein